MRNDLCQQLGIGVPIFQAPIGGAAGAALAAAVCNAGGLGALAVTGFGADTTRKMIQDTRAATSQPFAANFLMSYPFEEEMEVCLQEKVPAAFFYWGDPAPYVSRFHDVGALVIHQVGSVDEAKRSVDAGVDIIVAQGWEAGGHVRGTTATLALVPSVVDAITPVPVVAAGGIADGRGLAAVLAAGASAACIGTRFLASEEVDLHPEYRSHLLRGTAEETLYSTLFNAKVDTGWPEAPHRVLRNSTVLAWELAGRPPAGQRPNEEEFLSRDSYGNEVVRYQKVTARSDHEGNIEAMPHWAGQGVGLVNKVQPAAEIVREIAEQATAIIQRLAELKDNTD